MSASASSTAARTAFGSSVPPVNCCSAPSSRIGMIRRRADADGDALALAVASSSTCAAAATKAKSLRRALTSWKPMPTLPGHTGKRTRGQTGAFRQAGGHRPRCGSRAPRSRRSCRRRDSSKWRRASPRPARSQRPDRHWRASRQRCRARAWRYDRSTASPAPAAEVRAATSASRSTTHCRVVAPIAMPSPSSRM